jgi:hypothetical protein
LAAARRAMPGLPPSRAGWVRPRPRLPWHPQEHKKRQPIVFRWAPSVGARRIERPTTWRQVRRPTVLRALTDSSK